MLKSTARAKSTDPVQESLREQKSKWNKSVSEFIDDLINFKKFVNGTISKFSPEKARIHNPLPDKVHSLLSLLTMDFKDLAQEGHGIVSKQLEYSKNRKKSTKNLKL